LKNKIVVVVVVVVVVDVLSTTLRIKGGIALGCHGSDTNSDAMAFSCQRTLMDWPQTVV
jgi:uncharacterized membrane protein YqhA